MNKEKGEKSKLEVERNVKASLNKNLREEGDKRAIDKRRKRS